jgi:long-chain acyl-CoA synthetase
MYPPTIARDRPDDLAYLMAGSGASLTYGELDLLSNQLAHLLRDAGLVRADSLVIFLENHVLWPVGVAAGMRSGFYVVPVNWHLGATELEPILAEAAPGAVLTSTALEDTVRRALAANSAPLILTVDGAVDLRSLLRDQPTHPIEDERLGARVLFSGGTTGRPKAYRQQLLDVHPADAPVRHALLGERLGIDSGIRFLSPAPSYHAAPFTFQLMTLAAGGTVVCMESFDARAALDHLSRHAITHSQWVPTMLTRLLAVPDRDQVPLSATHRVAVTSGAPCTATLKQAIDDWWGPVLHEYYGASEGYGHTYISPQEARTHPGSVGRPLGEAAVRIVDDQTTPVPSGVVGRVCFETPASAGYLPAEGARERLKGMGDRGYLDEDGYLYLSGRETFMIISGGVNIYPEEIEAVLGEHPSVVDVAVFGVPHEDFGEQVKAVIQLKDGTSADEETAETLLRFSKEKLARFKVPRSIDFVAELPRLPTGKLNKTSLRSSYLQAAETSPHQNQEKS